MKALVKRAAEPGLDLVDVPEPTVESGQVLIKVARTGICGTDLHIRAWDPSVQSMVTPPVVLGHEIAGHIAAVGPGVDTLVEGDLVSVEGHIVCGRCRNCRAGRRQLCPKHQGSRCTPRRWVRRVHLGPCWERVASSGSARR